MVVDLFKIPIFIGNIDINKIKIESKSFKKTWISETPTTFLDKSKLKEEEIKYLMETIIKILEEKIKHSFELRLTSIWENNYVQKDFQEPHIHGDSDFSFIIYKKVDEGKTVFINPVRKFLMLYNNISYMFEETFMPKCRAGQIVIFPSFLEHMVLPSSNEKTISGNLTFKRSN